MADCDVIEDCFTGSNAPKDATHAAITHTRLCYFGYYSDTVTLVETGRNVGFHDERLYFILAS
jgi:hypothetical protein